MILASVFGVETLPFAVVLCVCVVMWWLVRNFRARLLDNLELYNGVHILFMLWGQVTVTAIKWVTRQTQRRRAAVELIRGRVSMKELVDAGHGTFGNFGRLVVAFVHLIQIALIALSFSAEWNPQSSYLGRFPCFTAQYNPTVLDKFHVSPSFVQGTVDFANIYMYGLPLADGLLLGFGAWPAANPMSNFSLSGEGPALVLRVDCESIPVPWNGTNLTSVGNGLQLHSIWSSVNTISADIDVLLPSYGFQDVFTDTPWVRQRCGVRAVMGHGKWTFNYLVDEWDMVTSGQATSFALSQYLDLERYQTNDIYANKIASLFEKVQDRPFDFLVPYIQRSIESLANDVWYAPSEEPTYSNFMSWGILPDGYYYPDLTWRGLVAGLAAGIRPVFTQFESSKGAQCPYYGLDGGGQMALNPTLLSLCEALILSTGILAILNILYIHVICPVKEKVIFQQALLDVYSEWRRLCHASEFVASIVKSGKASLDAPSDIAKIFRYINVRLGESKATIGKDFGKLCIGSPDEVVKMKIDRKYI
jgi:hypothetical protein